MMRLNFFLFIAIVLFISPLAAIANNETSSIEKLNQISDEALQMTKSSRYEDAKRLLEYISDEFLTYTMGELSYTSDEIKVVSLAYQDAMEATTNTSLDHDEKINQVTKFRLAVDAIQPSYRPLWIEFKKPVLTLLRAMQDAASSKNMDKFHETTNQFLKIYEMIYPSLKLNVSPEKLYEVHTRVSFVDQYRSKVINEESHQKELTLLENDMKKIFDQVSENEADPSLWWVIFTTGSIIFITLTYVGWRKYQGDKEKRKEKIR